MTNLQNNYNTVYQQPYNTPIIINETPYNTPEMFVNNTNLIEIPQLSPITTHNNIEYTFANNTGHNTSIIENVQNQQKILNFFIKKYEKEKHTFAAVAYYYTVLYKIYFITTTILMSIISILSFVVASNVCSSSANTWISLSTGILGIICTTIYNLSTGFKLQVKLDQFNQSNIDFDDLLTELTFKKYEKDETCAHILKDIEVTIAKIKNRNKFAIPKIVTEVMKYKNKKNNKTNK